MRDINTPFSFICSCSHYSMWTFEPHYRGNFKERFCLIFVQFLQKIQKDVDFACFMFWGLHYFTVFIYAGGLPIIFRHFKSDNVYVSTKLKIKRSHLFLLIDQILITIKAPIKKTPITCCLSSAGKNILNSYFLFRYFVYLFDIHY